MGSTKLSQLRARGSSVVTVVGGALSLLGGAVSLAYLAGSLAGKASHVLISFTIRVARILLRTDPNLLFLTDRDKSHVLPPDGIRLMK